MASTNQIAMVLLACGLMPHLRAELPAGTWVRRAIKDGSRVTMTVEASGPVRIIAYRTERRDGSIRTVVVKTELDGKDSEVSVDGQRSAQTIAFRALDDRHTVSISKVNGKPVNTGHFKVSSDETLITVHTVPTDPGKEDGFTDYWDKQ